MLVIGKDQCPICAFPAARWIKCKSDCLDPDNETKKVHYHLICGSCGIHWYLTRKGEIVKVTIYFMEWKFAENFPPGKVHEFDTAAGRNAIAGHVHNVLGPLVEIKTWQEEREVAGSSSSGQPVHGPASQLSDVITENAALKRRLEALESKVSGTSPLSNAEHG